ncbi:DNA alkylation repair protein [Methanobrevibacter sp. OttesenSCG-928-I08]|nr:DNA alkylation repair protein [Methanobrevibacter sp. OttesenSCG-928-I08]
MGEPFKNIFNEEFFNEYTKALKNVIGDFDEQLFLSQIMDDKWENKGIVDRGRHLSTTLKNILPSDYKTATDNIIELINYLKETPYWSKVQDTGFGLSLEYGFLGGYVGDYGLDDYETSIETIEEITQFTSCEGAVRPFILKYPDEMMKQMLIWSKHENWAVRRVSSEGCRPRLPWHMALPNLKENPSSIIPILENLKNDPSESVRKSVANNLNDIVKDNPKIVIDLVKKWKGESKNTDWIIKHGCRTLLKQGNSEVMELFGFGSIENIKIEDFHISTPKVKIGESLEFNFKLLNNIDEKSKIRLEYAIYYQKANGTLSKKVYKISEKEYKENSVTLINRKQSFKLITTRKFHLGLHKISIIINGNEFEKHDFELIE